LYQGILKEFKGELKVVQPEVKSDIELRVEALENELFKDSKSKKNLITGVGPLRFELRIPAV
jgi:hypothetical protein